MKADNNFLEKVALELEYRAEELDFPAVTVEYPGCVVLTFDTEQWWFGTANECWGGNDEEGARIVQTTVPSHSTDVNAITQAIIDVMQEMKV